MDEERGTAGDAWFALFNEIGILAQLSRALFESRMPEGLTLPHFSVLNHCVRVGDGRSPLELARAFQVPKTSMTHTLATLEARGLIETRPNPRDGRGKQVHITAAGRDFRAAAIAGVRDAMTPLLRAIDPELAARLIPDLRHLRETLDRQRDGQT